MSEELVRVRGLRKSFETGDGTIEVLCGVDLTIDAGERLALERLALSWRSVAKERSSSMAIFTSSSFEKSNSSK